MTTTTVPPALDALNRLVRLATGFCRAQTFFTACTLGVFDALDNPRSTSATSSSRGEADW